MYSLVAQTISFEKDPFFSLHLASTRLSKETWRGEWGGEGRGKKTEEEQEEKHKLPLWNAHAVQGHVLDMHMHGTMHCSPLYRWGSWDSRLSPSPKMMHEQGWIQDSKPGLCDSRACARERKRKKAYFPPGPVLGTVTCLISLPSWWSCRAKVIIPIS